MILHFLLTESITIGTANVTPKKIYPKKSVQLYSDSCRLCASIIESRHLVRVLSATGKQKNLQSKILQECHVCITEADYLPTAVCRKCVNFVTKMCEFRQQCIAAQMTLKQNFSVKRQAATSPINCKQPAKRNSMVSEHQVSKGRALDFEAPVPEGQHRTEMNIPIGNKSNVLPVQCVSVQIIRSCQLKVAEPVQSRSGSVYVSNYHTYVTTPLTPVQQAKIERASKTAVPTAIADIITTYCPSVETAIKRNMLDKCKLSSDALCKRSTSESSVLYSSNEQYNVMSDFNIDKIWVELKTHQPFLIDALNAISGKECDIDKTADDVKVKYCFIYSIVMNIRWHEFSLLQRIITVLLIEGGCGKQVSFFCISSKFISYTKFYTVY